MSEPTPAAAPGTPPAAPATPPATPAPPVQQQALPGIAPTTPPPPPAPPSIEVKVPAQLPQGYVAERTVSQIKAIKGMTPELAQELFDMDVKQYGDAIAAREKTQAEWDAAVKADPKIGGDHYAKTQELVTRGIDVAKAQPLLALLTQVGLAKHPEVVKHFAALGERIKEDSIGGGTPPTTEPTQQDRLRAMFPSMFNADGTPKD